MLAHNRMAEACAKNVKIVTKWPYMRATGLIFGANRSAHRAGSIPNVFGPILVANLWGDGVIFEGVGRGVVHNPRKT